MSYLDDLIQQQEQQDTAAPTSYLDNLIAQTETPPTTPAQKKAIIPTSHPLAPTEIQAQANASPFTLPEFLAPAIPGMMVPSLLDTASKLIGGVPTEPAQAPDFTSPAELKSREAHGVAGTIIDNLNRLGSATRKFIQTIPEEGLSLNALADAFKGAASELANPTERRTTMDMLTRWAPMFVARNPQVAQQLSFIGDMSTDPVMALSAGTDGPVVALSDGTKVALNPEGEAMLAKKVADVSKLAAENPNYKTMIESGIPKAEQALKSAALKADQAIMLQAKNWMADIIAAGDQSIVDKGGIKVLGKTIPKTPELLDAVGKLTHIDDIKNWLSTMSGRVNAAKLMKDAAAAGKPLSRQDAEKLAEQTTGLINRFQIHMDNLKDEANNVAAKFFLDRDLVTPDQRDMIGAVRQEIRDTTTKEIEAQGATVNPAASQYETNFPREVGVAQGTKAMGAEFPSALTSEVPTGVPEANRMADMSASEMPSNILGTQPGSAPVPPPMPETASEIATRVKEQIIAQYRKTGLSAAAEDAINALGQIDDKIYEGHQAAGIIYDRVLNHAYRMYEAVPEEVTKLRSMIDAGFPKEWLPQQMQTQYKYLQDALDAGKEPIFDAAKTLAGQLYDAHLTANARVLNDTIKELYGTKSFEDLPLTVQKDLRFVGNSRFSWFGADRSSQFIKMLKGFDTVQNAWKKYATSASEFFGLRQAPQNILQTFLGEGPKALKSVDPTILRDVAVIYSHGKPGFETAGEGLRMVDTNGRELPNGAQLSDLFKELGIFKGTNVYTEAKRSEDVAQLIDKQTTNNFAEKALKDHFVNLHGPQEGEKVFNQTMTGLDTVSHFLHWPSIVEDINRGAIALSHLRNGKSLSELAPLVNRSLFDYSHQMGEFQTQVVKRVIPFFTYTKFMGELAAKTLVTHPGRISGVAKFATNMGVTLGKLYQQVDAMEKGVPVNPKNMLSPQDKNVLPGRLFDDVAGYAGIDPDLRKRFLTFHNFSPLDILDTFNVYDDNGRLDMKSAARNVMGRMISPFIRTPISDAQGFLLPKTKDIFSDQVLFDPNKPGKKIGPETLRPEDVLNNMVANVVNTESGRVELGAITRALGMANISPADIPAVTGVFKWLLGWKVAADPYTGKNYTYVNPWMAFNLGALYPQFGRSLSIADPSKSIAENGMETALGIKVQRLDMEQQRGLKLGELQRQYNDILDDIRHSRGSSDRVEKLQQQAQDVMQQIQQFYATSVPPIQ